MFPTSPLPNLNKLWVAVEVAQPLYIEAADTESFIPHPGNMHGVVPSETIEAAVNNECLAILRKAHKVLTDEIKAATRKKKAGLYQTGICLNALVDLVKWAEQSSESAETHSTHWNHVTRTAPHLSSQGTSWLPTASVRVWKRVRSTWRATVADCPCST